MCGRYMITSPGEAIRRVFDVPTLFDLAPRYNVAPSQEVPVVRIEGDEGRRDLALLRWGLIPSWAKDPGIGNRMINARAETLTEKPSFRAAFKHRRCLVVADGFYEWQKRPGGPKQPYFISPSNREPMGFAGLWERWRDPAEGPPIETCTIVTTSASEELAPIHGRMPVIVAPANFEAWLDTSGGTEIARSLLTAAPPHGLIAREISTRVNNVRNQDESILAPLPGP